MLGQGEMNKAICSADFFINRTERKFKSNQVMNTSGLFPYDLSPLMGGSVSVWFI